jgi:hypothetical protein
MSDLSTLLAGLTRQAQALLIGGHALQAYGVTRQTLDIDMLVSEGRAEAARAILEQHGYGVMARSPIFARHRHPSPTLPDVDILYVDEETATKMLRHPRELSLAGTVCLVPTLSHLLALKLHAIRNNAAREPRDFADIVELLRANPGECESDELRRLCTTYGPAGLWDKLEAALWKNR